MTGYSDSAGHSPGDAALPQVGGCGGFSSVHVDGVRGCVHACVCCTYCSIQGARMPGSGGHADI